MKTQIKRLWLLAIMMCTTLGISAHDLKVDGFYYNITSSSSPYTVAVTYRGSSPSEYSNEYTGSVTIPESVTYNTTTYSVTSIDYYAFRDCSALTSITIPNSVTSIGDYAFEFCTGLTSVTISNSVETIGIKAFRHCESLTSIVIPGSVKTLEEGIFSECYNLTTAIIEEGVETIGTGVFYMNKSVENKFTSVTIPSSVTSIGSGAFYGCSGLRNLYCYAEDVPTTNTSAFVNTDISNITLHVPAESLDDYAATAPWSEFGNIVAIVLETDVVLTDGAVFTNVIQYDTETISYTRNFTNTNWQALYVPFEMQYEDWKDDFEVARINNVNQYDDDEDGNVDRTVLEVFKVKSGQTEAHTPYLIKAKTTGEKTISLTDATLYKAEEKSYDVSSWNTLYTFTGTYTGVSGATMFGEGYYALGSGSLHQAADATNALSPFRWYMAVTDRDGNPKNIGEVKVMVFGMEEDELIETGLEEVGRDAISTNEQPVFDLNGRRVTNPRKGLYIKNGKKFVVK